MGILVVDTIIDLLWLNMVRRDYKKFKEKQDDEHYAKFKQTAFLCIVLQIVSATGNIISAYTLIS